MFGFRRMMATMHVGDALAAVVGWEIERRESAPRSFPPPQKPFPPTTDSERREGKGTKERQKKKDNNDRLVSLEQRASNAEVGKLVSAAFASRIRNHFA